MAQFVMLLACLLAFPRISFAQGMFAGFAEFCGVRVVMSPTPQMAVATVDAHGPVILLDPSVMGNWTASRAFAVAHECGHHKLGHITPRGMAARQFFNATRRQELESDCWAARALVRHGYRADLQRAVAEFAAQGAWRQGPYPYGFERAQQVAQCAGLSTAAPVQVASQCVTPYGSCGMSARIAAGSSCICPSPYGGISGVAR